MCVIQLTNEEKLGLSASLYAKVKECIPTGVIEMEVNNDIVQKMCGIHKNASIDNDSIMKGMKDYNKKI